MKLIMILIIIIIITKSEELLHKVMDCILNAIYLTYIRLPFCKKGILYIWACNILTSMWNPITKLLLRDVIHAKLTLSSGWKISCTILSILFSKVVILFGLNWPWIECVKKISWIIIHIFRVTYDKFRFYWDNCITHFNCLDMISCVHEWGCSTNRPTQQPNDSILGKPLLSNYL